MRPWALLLLIGQLVVEAAKRVDLTLLAAVVGAVRESETSDDLDKLILLARLEALAGIVAAADAQKSVEGIRAL